MAGGVPTPLKARRNAAWTRTEGSALGDAVRAISKVWPQLHPPTRQDCIGGCVYLTTSDAGYDQELVDFIADERSIQARGFAATGTITLAICAFTLALVPARRFVGALSQA